MKLKLIFVAFCFLGASAFANNFTVNKQGLITNGIYSIIVFQNNYAVGKQSGIELFKNNTRLASNGTLVVELKNGEIIKQGEISGRKTVGDNTVMLDYSISAHQLNFTIKVTANNNAIHVHAQPNEGSEMAKVEKVYFEMDFYFGYYAGKTFMAGDEMGILPHDYLGGTYLENGTVKTKYLAKSDTITLAPEDEFYRLAINGGENNQVALYDGRYNHKIGWFRVQTLSEWEPDNEVIFEVKTTSNTKIDNTPRVIYPEIGYHTNQPKDILLEFDYPVEQIKEGKLLKLSSSGAEQVIKTAKPEYWGQYYNYHYLVFTFDEIVENGLYRFEYGQGVSSDHFMVAHDIYSKNIWQPTLTSFMPVQMCHMRVVDRSHIWHGACHLDDGLQATVDTNFFDGFRQNKKTDTNFEPLEHIPGMNVGGWHDAGDDDINTNSNAINLYALTLTVEEFGIEVDETAIDFANRQVIMNQPDGENDALQQIKHGVAWMLAPFQHGNYSYAGVISSSFEQYLFSGDWASYSDNLFYNAELPEDSATATHSGKLDDRYVFTNRDSRRDYFVAAVLDNTYRVLKNTDAALAEKCLQTALKIHKVQTGHEPIIYNNVGNPPNLTENKINALVELYLSTGDATFIDAIVEDNKSVFNEFETVAWTISRVIDKIDNKKFTKNYQKHLTAYAEAFRDSLSKSPFGTVDRNQVWGTGWEIQWKMYKHYFLIKHYPDLFPAKDMYNGLHYQLGRHPASNISLVSGVGSHEPIPAFGINRDHMHYMVGGVFSGPAKILPGFIELKDDTPYIWQQSEYIISGAGPYIFMVLATKKLLEN
ncbi:MAG: glycoside hydrolase family 9 protein [Prolixibacteraceae bacterium]|nr:glycoside hydrolase family 9 protein [Prolixibacteraceae bacterium]